VQVNLQKLNLLPTGIGFVAILFWIWQCHRLIAQVHYYVYDKDELNHLGSNLASLVHCDATSLRLTWLSFAWDGRFSMTCSIYSLPFFSSLWSSWTC
jgi:hypothetical protein